MTKPMSSLQRLQKRAKSHGYDVEERSRYWKSEEDKLAKELKMQDEKIARLKSGMKEETQGMVGGVPANNVSSGNIDGLGVGPRGEPGVHKKKKKSVMPFKMFDRNPPKLA
jgi:hypothetical protein